MNLAALNTLRAILVHGNFTTAGLAVGCTPSAVSLQIKQLEQFLGQPLFDRSTRSVRATPFAIEIAAAAADFIERVDQLRVRPSMAIEGLFRLGVITSMQSDVLPAALRALRARHPQLSVRIPPLNDSDELLAELRAGRIDAALLVRPENGGSTRLVWCEVYRQPYVMLAPTGAHSSDPKTLLRTYGWIAYDTSLGGGRTAARQVRSLDANIQSSMELRSVDAIVSMVSEGMGVTVLPLPRRPILRAYAVKEIGLGRTSPCRHISLVWRRADDDNRNVAAVATAFSDLLIDAGDGGA